MEIKKFSELVPGQDKVWGVYNKNEHIKDSLYEYVLVCGDILINEKEDRKINIADAYEEPSYQLLKENRIDVIFDGIDETYSRYYSDFYDEKGQMLMFTTKYFPEKSYSSVEMFSSRDAAVEYLKNYIKRHNKALTEQIEKIQKQMKAYENCIINIKNK